jgi:hypothetical protein
MPPSLMLSFIQISSFARAGQFSRYSHRLLAGRPRNRASIRGRGQRFIPHSVQTACGAYAASSSLSKGGGGGFFSVGKAAGA